MGNMTVAITGVSSGIGAAAAQLFKQHGAHVIGFDRNPPDGEIDEFHCVDLSDAVSIENVVGAVDSRIDALCNIAGLPPTADKHAVLKVNFFGLRHFVEQIADKLSPNASIVSVASLAGLNWRTNASNLKIGLRTPLAQADSWIAALPVEGAPSYHLSKELLIAWNAMNWDKWRDRGIRMNTVSPGPVATPILKDFIETLGKRAEDDLKLNRAGLPTEIAPIIYFLCTPEAHWINGADIGVDGGAGASAWRQMLNLVD